MERLVNLAFFFDKAGGSPVTAEQIRTEVADYPADQDTAAFLRMFERDKDDLRRAGLVIAAEPDGTYRLDVASTFAAEVDLSAEEAAALRAVGVAMLDDPAFPFSEDLRFALAKIATALATGDTPVVARTADELPSEQGRSVAVLDAAVSARKRVAFEYTNSLAERKHHEVEPLGLFARDGRWYLVGRDVEIGERRVYALARLESLSVNPARPKSPDYEPPADFDVASFVGLPFQYASAEPFDAVLRFESEYAWRAPHLCANKGRLESHADGCVSWYVEARSASRLARWLIENGPGITPVSPPELVEILTTGLRQSSVVHRGGLDA
jgi:proteasome accessory factor B